MRTPINFKAFVAVFAALTIAVTTGTTFAQGRGHGGGHGGGQGNGRGNGQQQRGGRGDENRGDRGQFQRQGWQGDVRGQRGRPDNIRQDRGRRDMGRGRIERQAPVPGGDYGQRQIRPGRPDVYYRQDIIRGNQPRYRGNNAWPNNYGNERSREVHLRNAERKAWKDQEKYERRYRGDDYGYYGYPAYPNNYGYERSREVHLRNAERKAWKDEEKYARRRYRDDDDYAYYGYPAYPAYVYSPYVYRVRPRWNDVLRDVVLNTFSFNAGYVGRHVRWSVSFGQPYYRPYYLRDRYAVVPRFWGHAYRPYPVDAVDLGYVPAYYGDPYYPVEPAGVNVSVSFGSGFDRQLSDQLLATGYYQGYNDGLYAATAGYSGTYYDPYVYEAASYDPYSYSIGENRRCLSDGYQLGYEDAMNRDLGRDPNEFANVNLVSVLISSSSTVY